MFTKAFQKTQQTRLLSLPFLKVTISIFVSGGIAGWPSLAYTRKFTAHWSTTIILPEHKAPIRGGTLGGPHMTVFPTVRIAFPTMKIQRKLVVVFTPFNIFNDRLVHPNPIETRSQRNPPQSSLKVGVSKRNAEDSAHEISIKRSAKFGRSQKVNLIWLDCQ